MNGDMVKLSETQALKVLASAVAEAKGWPKGTAVNAFFLVNPRSGEVSFEVARLAEPAPDGRG